MRGDDEAFRRWLAWEQLTDRFQAGSMVTGVCYFDRGALSDEPQAKLAAVHPVRSASSIESPFTLYADDDGIRVTGELDAWSEDQFARLLPSRGMAPRRSTVDFPSRLAEGDALGGASVAVLKLARDREVGSAVTSRGRV